MKNKILTTISSFLAGSLLMSASYQNGISYYSTIAETNLSIISILSSGSDTVNQGANVTGNIAATMTVSYELFSMDKTTALYTNYVPVYSLVYRVDIYLDNDVNYKGGLFNWFNGVNPCYLNYISVSASFEGVSDIGKVVQSPNDNSSDSNIRLLEDVDPYNGYGTSLGSRAYSISGFETCFGIGSSSYYNGLDELDNNETGLYNSRIAARISSSEDITDNSVSFTNHLTYGYKIQVDDRGTYYATETDYYSGPVESESPFYFTYYGAMNIESETQPTNCEMTFKMNTTHGSSVLNDHFTNTATLTIDVI